MSGVCAFPQCLCVGRCQLAEVRAKAKAETAARQSSACRFPDCHCSSTCTYGSFKAPKVIPSEGPCPYCGEEMTSHQWMRMPTRDHVDPRSKGGTNHPDNLVWACRACNELKADTLIERWFFALQKIGDPRAAHVAKFIKDRAPDRPEDDQQEEAAA